MECDDGDPCTSADTCAEGVCTGDAVGDGTACNDGDPCTESDVCTGGACAGSPKDCDDLETCTLDACSDGVCTHESVDDGLECDDGDLCTSDDACAAGVCVGSTVLAPVLLPWLPGRAFALKGAWLGVMFLGGITAYAWYHPAVIESYVSAAAWCLIIPAAASFLAMNYTGASTYTSLSGVQREVRIAGPIQAACGAVGAALWVAGRFV